MGRRSEQRIAISFPVVVHGFDSRGSPFTITTETHDISCAGASLQGLNSLVEPGKKIEIECQDQKAWYRVQWLGKNGTSKAGRVGVRCLEPGKYIWGVLPREWEADTYDPSRLEPSAPISPGASPSGAGPADWTGKDRRQFARHACRIEAQVTLQDGSVRLPATVIDISLGGCYVEMLAPLTVDTLIELSLCTGDTTLNVSGLVRSSQTGMGMGVSFTGMGPQDFEKLRQFAPPAAEASQPANPPAPAVPPPQPGAVAARPSSRIAAEAEYGQGNLPMSAELFEAAMRVLHRKGLVTSAEVLDELEKWRTAKT